MAVFTRKGTGDADAIEGVGVDGRGVVGSSDTDYGVRAHSKKSAGLRGSSDEGRGVEGWATNSEGVVGVSTNGHGVWGQTEGTGTGVLGTSKTGNAIEGVSVDGRGVVGSSDTDYGVRAHSKKSAGLRGSSDEGRGVEGWATNSEGVVGVSTNGHGVWGQTEGAGTGVLGTSKTGNGGRFESDQGEGVRGTSRTADHGGVVGVNTGGGAAVYGHSDDSVGVWGVSVNHEGVHAETNSTTTSALAAYQKNRDSTTAALYAKHDGNGEAAHFVGNVFVTGDVSLANSDCAEDFDVSAESSAEPGSVMVLDDEGNLRESCYPYDKRVTGVISGAGNYKPGLVLGKQQSQSDRKPIALLGKVFCKVDADHGPIHVGDMLTTSDTPGHAMKAADASQAFGAVLGKALRSLPGGRGLVPILVALQ